MSLTQQLTLVKNPTGEPARLAEMALKGAVYMDWAHPKWACFDWNPPLPIATLEERLRQSTGALWDSTLTVYIETSDFAVIIATSSHEPSVWLVLGSESADFEEGATALAASSSQSDPLIRFCLWSATAPQPIAQGVLETFLARARVFPDDAAFELMEYLGLVVPQD